MPRFSLRVPIPALTLALTLAACASDRGPHGPGGHRPDGHGAGGPPPPRERVFLSPMGEPFRSPAGEGDPERAWFDGADANRDGQVTLAEFQADAARFFATLDIGRDGEIDPADIDRYENVVAPEVRSGGGGGRGGARDGGNAGGGGGRRGGGGGMRGGGMGGGGMGGGGGHGGGRQESGSGTAPQATEPSRQGAGAYSYLDIPEPVTAADANMNRGIDANEFAAAAAARFKLLDRNGDGVLTWDELPHVHGRAGGMRRPGGGGRPGSGGGPGGGFGGGGDRGGFGGDRGGFGGRPSQDQ